ncbi:15789_t:CDS:1 [Cetraspora pellucida]|uniref:15789_t:CDS:1 n=1 Tax=Cetraspora pellucida TaxID=1433469 RepID=A0A9N9JQM6_9GLOM|nr:15789_t:CDS:1 [Cetraspora pellucida]
MIIEKSGISRYFIQRLAIGFGEFDKEFINIKIKHNNLPSNVIAIKSWASNLPLDVYFSILKKATFIYSNQLCLKGNDLELLYLLSGSESKYEQIVTKINSNIDKIKKLIYKFKLIPFPKRQYSILSQYYQRFPSNDSYENTLQLNTIARLILFKPKLLNYWKDIGYDFEDINDIVMKGLLIFLYHPNLSRQNIIFDKNPLVKKYKEYLDFGFKLNYFMIQNIFDIYIQLHKLENLYDIFINSFIEILSNDKTIITKTILLNKIIHMLLN